MATIVTRAGKGSALTHTELDANFTNINADIATKPSTVFTGVFTTPSPSALAVTDDVLFSVEPSLRLDFVNNHRLDNRITFSRASSATRTNQSGLIETTVSSVPRFDFDPVTKASRGLLVEESRDNLLTYSEQFDNSAAWNKNLMLVTGGYISPSGATNAYLIDTATETAAVYPSIATTVAAATYVLSVFIKAGTASHIRIRFGLSSGSSVSIWYSVASKTFSNAGTGVTGISAADYGSGWVRVSVSITYGALDAGSRAVSIVPVTAANSVISGGTVFLWGAQLELGTFSTSYIPSTVTHTGRASVATYINSAGNVQTAANNVPRLQYSPQNLTVAPFLLLEGAATNLCTYSQDFTQTAWATTNSTKTTGVADPAGGVTAATITATGANGVLQNGNAVIVSGTTYTVSIWLRRRTGTGAVGIRAVENANIPVTITSTWARYSVTTTATQTFGRVGVYCSTIGDEIDFWGGQIETGTFASSYIPTTTAAATRAADTSTSTQTTRAADSAVINTLSPWYNAVEGTILAQTAVPIPAAYTGWVYTLGSFNTGIMFYRQLDNQPVALVRDASADSFVNGFGTTWATSAVNKNALAYKINDFASSNNSGTPGTDTTGTVPSVSILALGSTAGTSGFLNGYVQNFIYYPIRLSNTTLQALTK